MTLARCALSAALAIPLFAPSVQAQEETGPRLSIELNATEQVDQSCRMSFLIRNGHEADVESAVFEAVLFDAEGRVDRLTLFDFGTLPAGRPRVRQFLLSNLDCGSLGQVLINGAETCEAGELGEAACTEGLELNSRADVELIG